MTDNVKPQEAWNMATETLKRLSRCLDMCSFYSQRGNLIQWFHASMDLRRNLYPFLDKDEFKEIEDKINEWNSKWIIDSPRGVIINPKYYSSCNRVLDELYLLFIFNMKEKGLLMPKTIDPRAAVINN